MSGQTVFGGDSILSELRVVGHRRDSPPDPDTLTWLGGLRLAAVSC